MILVIILGLLALFSLISILLGTDEPRRSDVAPRNTTGTSCGSAPAERARQADSLAP